MDEETKRWLESVKRPEVIFSNFMIRYHGDAVFFFLEGNDWPFYFSLLNAIVLDGKHEKLVCYGRANVITLYKMVVENKKIKNVKFFVDKDYTNEKTSEFIYVTPEYSIENYYVKPSVLKIAVENEFKYIGGVEILNSEVTSIVELYRARLTEYLDGTLELDAICFYAKDKFRANLSEIDITNYIEIKLERVSKKYNLKDAFTVITGQALSSENREEISNIVARFSTNREVNCRGKFILAFFIKFIRLLIDDGNLAKPTYFSKKFKCSKTISEKTFISDFAVYSEKPKCLHKFLKNKVA